MKSLSQEEALKSILTKLSHCLEYIPIENCVGRTLATDMVSKIFHHQQLSSNGWIWSE